MSAETIREAAEVLRERAEAATPGPWNVDGPFWVDPPGKPIDESTVEARSGVSGRGAERALVMAGTWDSRDENPLYIATMHPGVGLALADLLDFTANEHEGDGPEGCWECVRWTTIARLILGGAS